MDNVLVDIRTHDEPFAESIENLRCKAVRFRRINGSMRFHLAHSALHSDEHAIERMISWLNLQKGPPRERVPEKASPVRTKATPLGLI